MITIAVLLAGLFSHLPGSLFRPDKFDRRSVHRAWPGRDFDGLFPGSSARNGTALEPEGQARTARVLFASLPKAFRRIWTPVLPTAALASVRVTVKLALIDRRIEWEGTRDHPCLLEAARVHYARHAAADDAILTRFPGIWGKPTGPSHAVVEGVPASTEGSVRARGSFALCVDRDASGLMVGGADASHRRARRRGLRRPPLRVFSDRRGHPCVSKPAAAGH